jgi:hypothetical protein
MLQSGPKDGVSVDSGEAAGWHTMSTLDRICIAWSSVVIGAANHTRIPNRIQLVSILFRYRELAVINTDVTLPWYY